MTKTFKEVIAGIRTAVLGREVREDIAQMGEYCEQFATSSAQSASAAASSAAGAGQSASAAATSASAAAKSASAAGSSAASAQQQANAAASSASAAKQQASAAAGSATSAKQQADAAQKSAEQAEAIKSYLSTIKGAYYSANDLTISKNLWKKASSSALYPYQADLPMELSDPKFEPSVTVKLESTEIAQSAMLAGTCETGTKYIRFWSQKIPSADIKIRLVLTGISVEGGSSINIATSEEVEKMLDSIYNT